MLHKFIGTIRKIGYASRFETYYGNIQRGSLSGAPTADEARKEYQRLEQSSAHALTY